MPVMTPPTYEQERDAIVPRAGYVELPDGKTLELPRLNLRRTLRLSQWLDSIGSRPEIMGAINELTTTLATPTVMYDVEGNEVQNPAAGLTQMLVINRFISVLDVNEALELFSILTGQSHEWLDEYWEPGWGIEAIKIAFQQQGFKNLFSGGTDAPSGETEGAEGKAPSQPRSIS